MIFQIAGLPRAGTAWIASVLNLCPDIMCVHEPIDQNVPVPQNSYDHSGQSGSHLLVPAYAAMESDLRVFINRAPADAYASMVEVIGGMNYDSYLKYMVGASREYEAMADIVIDFEELFTEAAVKYLWEIITEIPFNRDKALSMLNMNVQRESLAYDFDKKFTEEVQDHNNRKDQE